MAYTTVLFDLDGTLTDSGEGIINCASLALAHFGIPVPDRTAMRAFVGPPLHDMFEKFGVPADRTEEAVSVYRSRYHTVGKFENVPYPGIYTLLQRLRERGAILLVATSKPEALSIEILERFDLAKYFHCICGASLDRSRISKADVIAYLLSAYPFCDHAVMVGDTPFDVTGAAAHGIPTIGVSWGYGARDALAESGAIAVADTMEELYQFLTE